MLKIAVLVSGGGTNLQAIIDSIKENKITNAEIKVVISNNENAYALERARMNGIQAEYLSPKQFPNREAFGEALVAQLNNYKIDLVVLAGYLVIVPELLVKNYKNKIINVHPSLIPAFCGMGYYGLKVHEEALKRGVKLTGATVHFVDEIADHGPIILQKAVQVKEEDTPEILQKRVMEEAEWNILPQAIDLIANDKIQVENGYVKISL